VPPKSDATAATLSELFGAATKPSDPSLVDLAAQLETKLAEPAPAEASLVSEKDDLMAMLEHVSPRVCSAATSLL
jgi:hypothetical protein